MDEDLEIVVVVAAMVAAQTQIKRINEAKLKPKRIWVKEWILKFGTNGHYENVYREWRESDPEMYRAILRIYPEDFMHLLKALMPYIEKQCTHFRDSITAEKRLAITLRFLATGNLFTYPISMIVMLYFQAKVLLRSLPNFVLAIQASDVLFLRHVML